MAYTVTLPSGVEWVPQFAEHIEEEKCIGCGRCFRVCGRDVLQLVGINDEGERVAWRGHHMSVLSMRRAMMRRPSRRELSRGCVARRSGR